MKVIKQTSSELVFKNKPDAVEMCVFILFTITHGVFPLIAIFMILSQIGITTLRCKRVEPTQVSCEKQQSKFFGLVEQPPIGFSQVKSAKFESKTDMDDIYYYVVHLVNSSGKVTDLDVRGSASEMEGIATQINNFIQSNQPSLVIQQDSRWKFENLFRIGFTAIFVVFGASCLFAVFRSETLIFDKTSHRLIREKKTLLGKKYEYYPLDEIKEVDIETITDSDGDNTYHLQLKIRPKYTEEKILKLQLESSNKLQDTEKIQTTIRDFLQLS